MNRKRSKEELIDSLVGALTIIEHNLERYNETGKLYWLSNAAIQLRALIVHEANRRSLNHPLLVDLAKMEDFPLRVYVINPEYTSYVQSFGPMLHFSARPLRLEQDGPYSYEMELTEAIEKHTLFQFGEKLSFKDIIRSIGLAPLWWRVNKRHLQDKWGASNVAGLR